MSPALKKMLKIYRMTAPVGIEDLVFCNKAGNPIDPHNLTQLGHASIQTSIDRYGHVLPNTYQGVGERLDYQVFGDGVMNSESTLPIYIS